MNPDDPVCLCFHVTRRKVINFIRVEKPRRASQLSECFGAGTGCGWCRPYLQRLLQFEMARLTETLPNNSETKQESQATRPALMELDEMAMTDYAKQRAEYVRAGRGTPPPGAAPIENI